MLTACAVLRPILTLLAPQTSTTEARSQATAMVTALLPLLLRLLSDPHNETSCAVFPFAQAVLGVYKKEKKRAGPQAAELLTPERRLFLTELLKAAVQKMEYSSDAEWTVGLEGEEDEEALQFAEMRKVSRMTWLTGDQQVTDIVSRIDPAIARGRYCGPRPGVVRRRDSFDDCGNARSTGSRDGRTNMATS